MTVSCNRCSAEFKTAQGLAGHLRFRHGDPGREAEADRAHRQRLETLSDYEEDPAVPPATAVLIARLKRRYGDMKGRSGPTNCVVCGAQCRTSQGLAGHMRHRHGAGRTAGSSDRDRAGELLQFLHSSQLLDPVSEAVWEKVLRLSGFRW